MKHSYSIPPPPQLLKIYGASTASYAKNKCSTYQRYACALFLANSLYLHRLFSKALILFCTINNIYAAVKNVLRTDKDVRGIEQNRVCTTNSQSKNVHGSTFFNVPAGIFCALLVSASPISKRHFSTAMDGGGSTQQRGFCTAETPLKMYTDVHLLMRYLHRLFSKVFVLINTNYRCAKRTN